MNCHAFLGPFRYQFWHRFLMIFGIDFGSILGAFWLHFPILFAIDFWMDFIYNFFGFEAKKSSTSQRSCSLFGLLFVTLSEDRFDPFRRSIFICILVALGSLLAPLGSLLAPFLAHRRSNWGRRRSIWLRRRSIWLRRRSNWARRRSIWLRRRSIWLRRRFTLAPFGTLQH
jgi:hypothetical protein